MNFREEDFPLYQLLVQLAPPAIEEMVKDFERARASDDEEKYHFALKLSAYAASIPLENVPGLTEEIRQKTLRSCLAVFDQVAGQGIERAAYIAQYVRDNYIDPAYDEAQMQPSLELREEDFPVYQRLAPHSPRFRNFFEAAKEGGDQEKLVFITRMHGVMLQFHFEKTPSITQEMQLKTWQSIRMIAEDIAGRGHQGAAKLVAIMDDYGLGLAQAPIAPRPKPGKYTI